MLRLQVAPRSVLVLVTCGYIWTEGADDVKALVAKSVLRAFVFYKLTTIRGVFADIIGFSAKGLIPLAVAPWLSQFCQFYLFGNKFIRLEVDRAIQKSLAGHEVLGSHTSVIHVSRGKAHQLPRCHHYVWAPKSSRPWGQVVPQCGKCNGGRVTSIGVS
jgi:hypothetical protein